MYAECFAFLLKTMRVRKIVVLVCLFHSHGLAQKRNAFQICMRCVFARNHESQRDAQLLLSHSHRFAQKRNAFRIHGTTP